MNEKITFYSSYYTAIMKIKDPMERLKAFEAVCGYGITGEIPEDLSDYDRADIVFDMAKPTIDSNEKYRNSGSKGGKSTTSNPPSENDLSPLDENSEAPLQKNVKPPSEKNASNMNMNMNMNIDKENEYISNSNELDCPTQSAEPSLTESANRVVEEWNKLSDLGIKPISRLTDGGKRKGLLYARLKQYGEQETIRAIHRIRASDFLVGKNKRGWAITFDWFILPSNFPKVLEGNYDNSNQKNGVEAFLSGGIDDG